MKRILICLLLLTASWGAFAQNEAEVLLEKTADAIRRADGIKASFSVKMDDEMVEGDIRLKGSKFKLETEGVTTWFDGKTQWTLVDESQEVNISEPSAEELQGINPYAWLSLYQQGYGLKMESSSNADEKAIVMTSTQPRQDMQCIVLTVNTRTLAPVRVTMAGRGGKDVTVVYITAYDASQHYNDQEFVFPQGQYPGVEVVDLR